MATKMTPQDRYNAKMYDKVAFRERKEIVQAFKEKCKADGVSQAEILKKAVHDFLNNQYFG